MPSGLQRVQAQGQSIWLNNLSRKSINNGDLENFIDRGVSGIIISAHGLLNTLQNTDAYDSEMQTFFSTHSSFFSTMPDITGYGYSPCIIDDLLVSDVSKAADMLMPIYTDTQGEDGYVSIFLDPIYSNRIPHSVEQAMWLTDIIDKPNILVQVAATDAGYEIMRQLLLNNVNVHMTLIFSSEQYESCQNVYIESLEEKIKKNESISSLRSFVSFMPNRIDNRIDYLLEMSDRLGETFAGRRVKSLTGTLLSQIIYDIHSIFLDSKRFEDIASRGGNTQKIIWETIDPFQEQKHETLKYLKTLCGKGTVHCVDEKTLNFLTKSDYRFSSQIDSQVSFAYDFMDKWLFVTLAEIHMSYDIISKELLLDEIYDLARSTNEVIEYLNLMKSIITENI